MTVITSITSLTVSPTSSTLNIGETVQLTGTVNPSTTTESTLWTSSNTNVATVSSSGLVTAKSAGTATITFKNSSSTKLDSCKIIVVAEYITIGAGSNIIKYNSNGDKEWDFSTPNRGGAALHNAQYYDINTLAITSDNSIVVGAGPYIIKYNSNGDKVLDFITPNRGGTALHNAQYYDVNAILTY